MMDPCTKAIHFEVDYCTLPLQLECIQQKLMLEIKIQPTMSMTLKWDSSSCSKHNFEIHRNKLD